MQNRPLTVEGGGQVSADRQRNKGIAAVLLGGFCLLCSLQELHIARNEYPEYAVAVNLTSWKERYAPLKEMLAGEGAVGYITDTETDPVTGNNTGRILTQFFLYPVLVEAGTQRRYVIGFFQHTPLRSNDPQFRNFTLVRDFGNGLILFRRQQT
jgi:hypothetical protein